MTKQYLQAKAATVAGTLTVAGWDATAKTQTITVAGVTASNTVLVSPAPASFNDYGTANIYCSAQAANALTFTCKTVPTTELTVQVVIL